GCVGGSFGGGEQLVLFHQLLFAFDPVRVEGDAIDRAYLLALGFVEVADALGAEVGVNDIDFLALGYGPVGTFGFADVAVDAVFGNDQGHRLLRKAICSAGEALEQGFMDYRVNEFGDVAAQGGNFPHQGGRDVRILLRGREEQTFHIRSQLAVHVGQLEFIFEVGYRTQAAEQYVSADVTGEVRQQRGKPHHFDVGKLLEYFTRHVDPLFEREGGVLLRAGGDGDDHLVEQFGRATNQVGMPLGDGVAGAGIENSIHWLCPACGFRSADGSVWPGCGQTENINIWPVDVRVRSGGR